jgi:hypothetical protein
MRERNHTKGRVLVTGGKGVPIGRFAVRDVGQGFEELLAVHRSRIQTC